MAAPANSPTGQLTAGSKPPAIAPMTAPASTGRVEGWSAPCLPIAFTSASVRSTSVGSSGCCRATGSVLIDGEALAERANASPDIGLDIGVAMLALVAQCFEHVGDHVADFLKLRNAETARRTGRRADANAAGLDRWQRVERNAVLVAGDRAALERLIGVAARDAKRAQIDEREVGVGS